MGLIEALVLGLVQGLTEFLPVSSSGHLFLVPELTGWKDAGAGFTAVIQLGTLAALLIYFWRDLGKVFGGWLSSLADPSMRGTHESRLGWAIIVGTVPAAVAGLLLEKRIDTDFRSGIVVASALIFFGLLLGVADKFGKRSREIGSVSVLDGLVIGLWQCLALVPGSSRSGSTITGGLFQGLDRESAARFSFLLSVPVILASGLYKLFKDRHELMVEGAVPTILATVVAFLSGLWAIGFLMRYLQTRSTAVFVVYRVVLGLLVLVLILSGRVPAQPKRVETAAVHGPVQTQARA